METIEKDNDISGTRDTAKHSVTGSDDKVASNAVKQDIGTDEAMSASVADVAATTAAQSNRLFETQLRQQEEMHQAKLERLAELSAIRQRHLNNSADYDQDIREAKLSNIKSINEQRQRLTELAADRQWNIDEQINAAKKIATELGIDTKEAFKMAMEFGKAKSVA